MDRMEHDTRWLKREIEDAHRCAQWDWNASLRSARRALEFDAELAERSTCVREDHHIANPLEYPLRCARHTAKVCAFAAVLGWGAAIWLAIWIFALRGAQ